MTWSNPFAAVPLESLLTAWDEMISFPPVEEGWSLFESDTYGFEIEHDQEEGVFSNDDEARAYVRARAKGGSPLHQMALAIHEAQEAANREAAAKAGYRVRCVRLDPEGTEHGHGFVRPGEFAPVHMARECRTETAAWSAAWRDLLERGGDDDA